jgi:hypothetical protein
MGLFDVVKGVADVVTTPFAVAGSVAGSVGGFALGGALETAQFVGNKIPLLNKLVPGDAEFDTSDIFTFSALGGKLGQFAAGFGAKFLLPGGLVTGLLFGGLSLTNGWADEHVLNPILKTEAKLLGLGGGAAGDAAQQFPAICGPEGQGPDGGMYQAIAVPLPQGVEPTGPTKVDPETGQVYQLEIVPAGACVNNVVTVTPDDMAKTAGMAKALGEKIK